LLLDSWPNAGRRSFAALGRVEALNIFRGALETPALAHILLRARNALLLAIMESAARCRAPARPLCRNGVEGIKALVVVGDCHGDGSSRMEAFIQALKLRSQGRRGRATTDADTPIKTDYAFDALPRSGRSPTLVRDQF
jgi:hypothetical protein